MQRKSTLDCVFLELLEDKSLQHTKQTQENIFILETFIMRLNCRKYGDKAYSYFLRCKTQHCKGKVEQAVWRHKTPPFGQ